MRCVPVNSIKVWDYEKIKLIEIRDLIRADFFTHSPKSNDVNSSISKRLNFQHNLFLSYSYCELLGATTKDVTFLGEAKIFQIFTPKAFYHIFSSPSTCIFGEEFWSKILKIYLYTHNATFYPKNACYPIFPFLWGEKI